jgi:predicted XRE-type DNA-binding protein
MFWRILKGLVIMTKEIAVEESSGNVFADLGYPNPQDALAKSRLAQRIAELLEEQHLTQVEAATLLCIDQPKVSKLLRGQLREFSTDRLFRFLNVLHQDVEIVIRQKPGTRQQATVSVIPA